MLKNRSPLLSALLMLIFCASVLVGATYAQFTDNITVSGNVIQAANLKAELSYWASNTEGSYDWKDATKGAIFNYALWEPGYSDAKFVKVRNGGKLAFQYMFNFEPTESTQSMAQTGSETETEPGAQAETPTANLMDVIDVYYGVVTKDVTPPTQKLGRTEFAQWAHDVAGMEMKRIGTMSELNQMSGDTWGVVLPENGSQNVTNPAADVPSYEEEVQVCIVLHMQELAGNEYMGLPANSFKLKLTATQYAYENDAFGSDYDDIEFRPKITANASGRIGVADVVNENGQLTDAVSFTQNNVTVTAPAGTQLNPGVTELVITIKPKAQTDSNVQVLESEDAGFLDIHVEGVSPQNTVPLQVSIDELLPVALNIGNYRLYHVENGQTIPMTLLTGAEAVHNNFSYDPADGDVTMYMATFSEVAVVADTEAVWNGTVAKDFSGGNGTEDDPYIIANADQLAYLGDRVSNDNANYGSAHYKLIANVDMGGEAVQENGKLKFYPIGYTSEGWKGSFSGTFDGAGHTVSNIFQNTWMLLGTYDGTYYNAAMGLFGYVNGGVVKNLTVDNFKSEGEFAPTGCVAAYAANATFENIAITNSHPATYNTSVAAVVGRDGASGSTLNFKNITVDSSNTVSALWGSWDVGAAGLLGYLGSDDKVNFENCHVSATIDVYNDVCGNYQYYWYRYCGAFIGTVDKRLDNGNGALDLSNVTATNCTVNFGNRHEYYYCEFIENTKASYTHDYQMSRVSLADIVGEGDSATCQNHNHEEHGYETVNGTSVLVEDKQAVYLPFYQLFGGYGWGVDGADIYDWIDIKVDKTEDGSENEGDSEGGDTEEDGSIGGGGITQKPNEPTEDEQMKFKTKFTGDFLYRVGNKNEVTVGSLFEKNGEATIIDSGVHVSIDKVDKDMNVSGTFTANTSDWTQGKIQFSNTGVVKVTIQDYNYCIPTVLYLEVIDATNLTSATGTTTGGNFVLLCDVNTSTYVNYWNCTLYGNGFTYSLNGAPTAYNSKQGKGILITKNATLDNLVIVGDVYTGYGAYTENDYYNTAIDVTGDTTIQNCYISGCAAPVRARNNVTIKNTTLYGGAVANLILESGTAMLEDVTTANYDDGRAVVGMGIVVHSDATEAAKLVLNGTLTQYNFISEKKVPTDTYAKNLHTAMFGNSCSKYHFGSSSNRYVNTGIISLTTTFDDTDITDNANTGYDGTDVTLGGVNGYVYTQPNTSGSVDNGYDKENDSHVSTTQGAVPPSYNFDYTSKNYQAKTDGSNDYCYAENGKVNISMDEGDTFNWDTSILTLGKGIKDYTVSMNGTDYTGKSIAFNTAGDYTVTYTYTDDNNYKLDENKNITTYSVTYTKTVNITVAVVKATTKHAEFTFGSSNTASTTVTIGNNTYVMPNVEPNKTGFGSTKVSEQTIYYPIVEIIMSDGETTSHSSGWYAYFPVFSGAVTITDYKDNGLGDAETFDSSTQSMPSGLSVVGDPKTLFKYQSGSNAGETPVKKNNMLVYSSAKIEADRNEYNTVIQYSYKDNAGTTYYYYIGYHAPAQSYSPGCVTPDTLVTLADGSKKEIQYITPEDQILAWDFEKGEYTVTSSLILTDHGESKYVVTTLFFEDGTSVDTIASHGFFDLDENEFVFLDENSAKEYVGHRFVKASGDQYTTVKLVDYKVETKVSGCFGLLTTKHYTCYLEDMLTLTPELVDSRFLIPFDIGENLTYDANAKQNDIDMYGLYEYEDFAGLVTKEEFDAFNAQYMKIAVGKGIVTYEDILYLIEKYL